MFCSEFYAIPAGQYFGLSEHPTRDAAERYAVAALVELGETELDARLAVSAAGWVCADTSADGYGVRIFEKS